MKGHFGVAQGCIALEHQSLSWKSHARASSTSTGQVVIKRARPYMESGGPVHHECSDPDHYSLIPDPRRWIESVRHRKKERETE